jgi:NAD(P)-dependent dehydrogenase (short-subunit alcohol dehydrogenase family)
MSVIAVNRRSFSGKTALIIGGITGIDFATAKGVSKESAA